METDTRTHALRALALAAALTLSLIGPSAHSQGLSPETPDRIIYINGELLDEAGLAFVDQLNCGVPVPDGNYWLDLENRLWGHVGVAGQSQLPDCSSGEDEAPAAEDDCESKYRYYEDRMCYCYGMC